MRRTAGGIGGHGASARGERGAALAGRQQHEDGAERQHEAAHEHGPVGRAQRQDARVRQQGGEGG